MNKPKRVLYVDHTPFAGGAQLVLAEHIAELDQQKYIPYVVCSRDVPSLIDRYLAAGAEVKTIGLPRLRGIGIKSGWGFIQAIRQLRTIVIEEQIDLVVSNTTRASYAISMALLGSKVPTIWWIRDFLYPRLLFKILSPLVAKMIYVSRAIRDAYVSPDDQKAEVVYVASSIYRQLAQITDAQISQEKLKWGIATSDVVVGFMGRLVSDKGVEEVVEVANSLQHLLPQVKYLIVGTGKNQMNDVETILYRKIEKYGLEDKVVLAGYQHNEALYYSLFDIFVLPTREGEPFATSVVQAMMAGNTIIGSNAGGTPELVQDGVTGLLFTPKDAQELALCLTKLVNDQELRLNLAKAGKDRVLKYHREEVVTDQVEEIFEQVLARK